jgi:Nucleotidyl transferase
VFAYRVSDPSQYGVVKFDDADKAAEIIEKPKQFLSNWAITGVYFYDNTVFDIAAGLSASGRSELEIIEVNQKFFELKTSCMSSGSVAALPGSIPAALTRFLKLRRRHRFHEFLNSSHRFDKTQSWALFKDYEVPDEWGGVHPKWVRVFSQGFIMRT